MSRWFRFYDDAINDPKILKLSDEAFRAWVGMLCVASKTKGVLPATADLGFYLRMKPARVAVQIAQLVSAGLLDKEGDSYVPHNWSGRQYLSDGSASRVQRHREKRESLGLVGQWTAPKALRMAVYERDGNKCVYCAATEFLSLDHKTPEFRGGSNEMDNLQTLCRACNGAKRDMTHEEYVTRNDLVTLLKRPQSTEAENRTEQKETRVTALDDWPSDFREQFWYDYPHKIGKADAIAKLERVRKRGVSWVTLMDGLRRYVANKPVDRPWCNPATWLNQARWEDQPAASVVKATDQTEIDWDAVLTSFKKFGAWSKYAGPDLDSPECRAPIQMLAKYGLLPPATAQNAPAIPRPQSMQGNA